MFVYVFVIVVWVDLELIVFVVFDGWNEEFVYFVGGGVLVVFFW